MYHKFYRSITYYIFTCYFQRFEEHVEEYRLLELSYLSHDVYIGRNTLNVLRPTAGKYENAGVRKALCGCQPAQPWSCSSLVGCFCLYLLFPWELPRTGRPPATNFKYSLPSDTHTFSPPCSGFKHILWVLMA